MARQVEKRGGSLKAMTTSRALILLMIVLVVASGLMVWARPAAVGVDGFPATLVASDGCMADGVWFSPRADGRCYIEDKAKGIVKAKTCYVIPNPKASHCPRGEFCPAISTLDFYSASIVAEYDGFGDGYYWLRGGANPIPFTASKKEWVKECK